MSTGVPFIDVAAMTRDVRTDVEQGWSQLLSSGRFIGSDAVEEFERAWASYCGVPHAVGVGSGTDALLLTLLALRIGAGDEVIVPANAFIAAAEAVVLSGATPVFVDVSPDTLLITPAHLEAALTYRTAAVIVVHLYGQMPDMDALSRRAEHAGIALIEDAGQAHGASWRGQRAGSIGRAGCFSFYPASSLGAFGDAGAVVTADANLARRLRSLRDHGCSRHSRHDIERIGFSSRLDALQAVVLTAKLARLDGWVAARRSIAGRYRAAFGDGPAALVAEEPGSEGAYQLAVARVPDRAEIRQYLAAAGIETQIHYPIPCHWQVPYRHFAARPLPVVERSAGQILSLPMFPHMSDGRVNQVCDAICGALGTKEFSNLSPLVH
jgi:dTDP-4-amino-4,6-dideoxygalactose transaminase